MLADWVFKSETPTAFLWGGSVCVIVGFVSVSWDRKKDTTPAVTVAADSATIDTT
jgi:drug/metabolite transporter (DMT)-like permease